MIEYWFENKEKIATYLCLFIFSFASYFDLWGWDIDPDSDTVPFLVCLFSFVAAFLPFCFKAKVQWYQRGAAIYCSETGLMVWHCNDGGLPFFVSDQMSISEIVQVEETALLYQIRR